MEEGHEVGTAGGSSHDAVHHCPKRGPALSPYVRRQHNRIQLLPLDAV